MNQRPLRLALVRQKYTAAGGAERFVQRAMASLAEHGVAVTLVTRHWPADAAGEHLICDPPYLGSLWRDAGFESCVCRLVSRTAFDLVQSHERIGCCDVFRAGDGVHAEWLAQRARVQGALARLAVRLNPYHRRTLAAERRMFEGPRLKAVICNSRMVADEIAARFAIDPAKLHVIYSGVDTKHFQPEVRVFRGEVRLAYGIPDGAPVFLFVGAGWERKGLATFVGALAKVPGAFGLVVGRDKRARRFERLAMAAGVHGRLRFAGVQGDVRPFYGAADALVLPTLYDPFPNVALEAMACGLPVITSTKSGAAELVEENVSGFIRDALDTGGVAAAMARAAADSRALGDAARSAVEPYTLDAMSARLLAFYDSLLGR